jgi:type II secretory pathway pseudopilin PulG
MRSDGRGEGRPELSREARDRAVSRRRTDAQSDVGFTLIEVLAAVLIVSLVFGLLLESVTRNLADLGRARAESRAAQLAENRLRDLRAELEIGEKLEDGIKEGVFEDPDSDLHWQIVVVPQKLILPSDYRGEQSPSPLFEAPNERAPQQPTTPGQEPPLRMVAVRVFAADEDPNTVDPYIALVTAPPDQSRLQQLQGQQPGNQGNQRQGQGQGQGQQNQQPVDPMNGVLPGTNPFQNPSLRNMN